MSEPIAIRIKEAAQRFGFKESTLRVEAARGRLAIFRIGRADYTTVDDIHEMVRRCRDAALPRASTLIRDENSGLSETEQASCARDALRLTVAKLRSNSRATSQANTSRSARRHHQSRTS